MNQALYVGPPDQPDKYRLIRQVGTGGEARLWEAEIELAGIAEPVALKVLRVEREADIAAWQSRWAEQAEVLRFIRHPGVVGVREHFTAGGMHYRGESPSSTPGLYLAMNWIAGPTLREWTLHHRSPVDLEHSFNFLAQVADVLDWLHSGQATPSGRPVIHADVTANNVIVTPSGQAVLVDFGLARLAAGLAASVEGTGGYLAPEVRAAGAYSPASDRYAFGALVYFVLTGETAPSTLTEIRTGLERVAAAGAFAGSVDDAVRMFAPDPLVRPNCGDWVRSFRIGGTTSFEMMATVPPLAPGFGPPPLGASRVDRLADHGAPGEVSPTSKPRGRRRLIVALAGLAVTAGLVAGGLALRDGEVAGRITDTTSGADRSTETSGPTSSSSSSTSSTSSTTSTTLPSTPPPPVIDEVTPLRLTNDGFTIRGHGFGTLAPLADGVLPCFMMQNETGNWYAGYIEPLGQGAFTLAPCAAATRTDGSTVTVRISRWSDDEIRVEGLSGAYGSGPFVLHASDRISITVANAQTGATAVTRTTVVLGAPLSDPVISGIGVVLDGTQARIEVRGSGFGSYTDHDGLLPCFLMVDQSPTEPWGAGYAPPVDRSSDFAPCAASSTPPLGSPVSVHIESWRDDSIVISELTFGYLEEGRHLAVGDRVGFQIANAQTGAGPAQGIATVTSA